MSTYAWLWTRHKSQRVSIITKCAHNSQRVIITYLKVDEECKCTWPGCRRTIQEVCKWCSDWQLLMWMQTVPQQFVRIVSCIYLFPAYIDTNSEQSKYMDCNLRFFYRAAEIIAWFFVTTMNTATWLKFLQIQEQISSSICTM